MQSRALMRFVMQQTRSDPEFDPRQFQAANYVPQLAALQAGVKANYVLLGDGVVDQHLDRHLRALEAKSGTLTYDETRLRTALRILILRNDLSVSLWKRTDTYSNERDPTSFETFLRNAFTAGSPSPPHRELINAHGSYANWIASVLRARPGNEGVFKINFSTCSTRNRTQTSGICLRLRASRQAATIASWFRILKEGCVLSTSRMSRRWRARPREARTGRRPHVCLSIHHRATSGRGCGAA